MAQEVQRRTPPLYTRGRYELKMPWQVSTAVIYTCTAIRSFTDMEERGINVLEEIYKEKELDESDYLVDKDADVAIVTLESDQEDTVYVPDSYIITFPNMGVVDYMHTIVSVNFGAIPENISLDFTMQQMANHATEIIGVEPDVEVHRAPSVGVVTPEEHEVAEANRLSKIEMQETDHAQAIRLRQERDKLQDQVDGLEQIIKDHGLLSETAPAINLFGRAGFGSDTDATDTPWMEKIDGVWQLTDPEGLGSINEDLRPSDWDYHLLSLDDISLNGQNAFRWVGAVHSLDEENAGKRAVVTVMVFDKDRQTDFFEQNAIYVVELDSFVDVGFVSYEDGETAVDIDAKLPSDPTYGLHGEYLIGMKISARNDLDEGVDGDFQVKVEKLSALEIVEE